MPDGSMLHIAPMKPPAAIARPRLRFGLAALAAVGLHGAAVLPFVLTPAPPPPPTVVEDVEMAPATEAAVPQAADAASFAESVAAAEAEPVQATEAPSEPLQATAPPEPPQPVPPPPETLTQPPPEPLLAEPPPPEPVLAEAPEPMPVEAPEPVQAEAPPEEAVTAELPLPPPPPPAPPPPQRVAAPRPTPRPAPQPATSAPAAAASAAAPLPPAPAIRRPPPSYVGALMKALERHKDYPSTARWRRAEGVALLRFSMRRDGTVSAWRVERSSGHADLDDAVERMIRRASPLPAPPGSLPGDPVELTVPVRFSLR